MCAVSHTQMTGSISFITLLGYKFQKMYLLNLEERKRLFTEIIFLESFDQSSSFLQYYFIRKFNIRS